MNNKKLAVALAVVLAVFSAGNTMAGIIQQPPVQPPCAEGEPDCVPPADDSTESEEDNSLNAALFDLATAAMQTVFALPRLP